MADIHRFVSLGIGAPADIPHFVLVGLSPTGPVAVIDASPDVVIQIRPDDMVVRVNADDQAARL